MLERRSLLVQVPRQGICAVLTDNDLMREAHRALAGKPRPQPRARCRSARSWPVENGVVVIGRGHSRPDRYSGDPTLRTPRFSRCAMRPHAPGNYRLAGCEL